jgi:DNA-binding NarL/FixJ family response regulator
MVAVIVVEDSVQVRQGLERFLSKQLDRVSLRAVFPDGESALAWLEAAPKRGESFDVGLIDLGLPGASGFDVIAAARRLMPKAACMALTIWDDPKSVFQALQVGARGYLLKDTEPSKILDAIDEAHAGGSPLTPAIARLVVDAFRTLPKPELLPGDDAALTPREREVLELLAKGLTYAEVGGVLKIAIGTVQSYVKRIYEKLEVCSKAEATAVAIRRGIVSM